MAAARTLLFAAFAALALALVAEAHTPLVNKATLKAGKVVLTLEAGGQGTSVFPDGGGENVGDRLVAEQVLNADGHGHFRRYLVCTVISTTNPLGVAHQCALETYFALGSVMSQGTLYLLNGVLSGNIAIIGGTGQFKGLRGNEVTSFNTGPNTGTTKFFLS